MLRTHSPGQFDIGSVLPAQRRAIFRTVLCNILRAFALAQKILKHALGHQQPRPWHVELESVQHVLEGGEG